MATPRSDLTQYLDELVMGAAYTRAEVPLVNYNGRLRPRALVDGNRGGPRRGTSQQPPLVRRPSIGRPARSSYEVRRCHLGARSTARVATAAVCSARPLSRASDAWKRPLIGVRPQPQRPDGRLLLLKRPAGRSGPVASRPSSTPSSMPTIRRPKASARRAGGSTAVTPSKSRCTTPPGAPTASTSWPSRRPPILSSRLRTRRPYRPTPHAERLLPTLPGGAIVRTLVSGRHLYAGKAYACRPQPSYPAAAGGGGESPHHNIPALKSVRCASRPGGASAPTLLLTLLSRSTASSSTRAARRLSSASPRTSSPSRPWGA